MYYHALHIWFHPHYRDIFIVVCCFTFHVFSCLSGVCRLLAGRLLCFVFVVVRCIIFVCWDAFLLLKERLSEEKEECQRLLPERRARVRAETW